VGLTFKKIAAKSVEIIILTIIINTLVNGAYVRISYGYLNGEHKVSRESFLWNILNGTDTIQNLIISFNWWTVGISIVFAVLISFMMYFFSYIYNLNAPKLKALEQRKKELIDDIDSYKEKLSFCEKKNAELKQIQIEYEHKHKNQIMDIESKLKEKYKQEFLNRERETLQIIKKHETEIEKLNAELEKLKNTDQQDDKDWI